ncbi:unnamed protein product [Camellia sinensis]
MGTVGDSSEIIEEQPICQQQRQNIALEIPSRTNEGSTEDFVRINIPLTPNRTPKRVNFSPIPSPSYYRFNDSPSPLSTRAKSSMKSLFPKLSFKFRNTTSEIERAAILALGDSPADTWEKPLIRRTLSLSKLFTPKMKRTSSLPVTPIAHSNPESMHGGNTIDDYVVSLLTENGNTKDDLRLATDDALFTQNTEQQVQGVLNLIDLAGSERLSRSNWGPTERDSDGSICLDILQNQWSPIYDIAAILTSIQKQHCCFVRTSVNTTGGCVKLLSRAGQKTKSLLLWVL